MTVATHDPITAGNYLVMAGNHPVMAGTHPVMAGTHPVMAGKHPVMAGNHSVMAGNHPVMAGNHPVMAGLVPAIHVFLTAPTEPDRPAPAALKPWMAGTRPDMTRERMTHGPDVTLRALDASR